MRKPSLLVIFLTVFIDLIGFGIVLPLLPIYAKNFGEGLTSTLLGLIIGALMATFSAMQFILHRGGGVCPTEWDAGRFCSSAPQARPSRTPFSPGVPDL